MSSTETSGTQLTDRPVPGLHAAQLEILSTLENLHTGDRGEFDPAKMIGILEASESQQVIGIDIGGDKISIAEFAVQGSRLVAGEQFISPSTRDGIGYINHLEQQAGQAHQTQLPVGIAFPGPVEETSPTDGANVGELMKDLQRYGGDFKGTTEVLFGEQLRALANDAVAGTYASCVEAARRDPATTDVIYLINGSGLGAAAWTGGRVVATEVGHGQVVADLNPHSTTEACGLFDLGEPCIERVAGGKAGIEALWHQLTGKEDGGREIARLADEGNEVASGLYDNAAHLSALAVFGVAKALGIDITSQHVTVVAHGGVFKFEQFANRFQQILRHHGQAGEVILTHQFSDNACIDGAALAALYV